jgi:hypothetical protein
MSASARRAEKTEKRSWSISRVLSWTAIPLGPELLQGSSHLPASSAGRLNARLFGVAPGGGCRVSPLPRSAGSGVFPHPPWSRAKTRLCGPVPHLHYTALNPPIALRQIDRFKRLGLQQAMLCLVADFGPRATYSGRELPATVPCGARTFLYAVSGANAG